MTKHKVLSTKGLDPSVIEKAKAHGIVIKEQEAIRIQPILTKEKWDEIFSILEKRLEHAVFTSSNAVTALKKYLNDFVNHLPPQWKIFCLSGKTKDLLVQNEEVFGTIEGTADNAGALAKVIISKGVKEVLFFCGSKRREELPAMLKRAGVQVHEVVVYDTVETPITMEEDFGAILFFSPSAVQSFFAANQLKENTVCFAIGQTTAESITPFTRAKVITSKAPTQEDLLNEVVTYFTNIPSSQY